MGLIRKTLAVGTLGAVAFRSKKEQLQRAERSRAEAEAAFEREHAARLESEARVAAAEKRLKHVGADVTATKRHEKAARRHPRTRESRRMPHLLAGTLRCVRGIKPGSVTHRVRALVAKRT